MRPSTSLTFTWPFAAGIDDLFTPLARLLLELDADVVDIDLKVITLALRA